LELYVRWHKLCCVIPVALSEGGVVGVAGIAGTLLASLGSVGATVWIERRKHEREQKAARADARVAARLVSAELTMREGECHTAVQLGSTPPGGFEPQNPEWEQHRTLLARALDVDGFDRVAVVYKDYEVLARFEAPGASIDPTRISTFMEVEHAAQAAIAALRTLVLDE
jgi:hypothetical protein